jgi:hypothetical protein
MDNEMVEHEPEVLIIGGGQKCVVLSCSRNRRVASCADPL